jgi:hypothetical protein
MGAMDVLRWGFFWTEAALVLVLAGEGFFAPTKRRSRKEEAVLGLVFPGEGLPSALGFEPSGTTDDGFAGGSARCILAGNRVKADSPATGGMVINSGQSRFNGGDHGRV